MPLLFELIVLALVAYGAGLALGWLAWGQPAAPDQPDSPKSEDGEMDR